MHLHIYIYIPYVYRLTLLLVNLIVNSLDLYDYGYFTLRFWFCLLL